MDVVHVDPIRVAEKTGQGQTDEDCYLNTVLVEAQTRLFLIKGFPLALESPVWQHVFSQDCYSILPGGDRHVRCVSQGPH